MDRPNSRIPDSMTLGNRDYLYIVQAVVTMSRESQVRGLIPMKSTVVIQVPTFLLSGNILGLMDEGAANRFARDMIEGLVTLGGLAGGKIEKVSIDVVKAPVEVRDDTAVPRDLVDKLVTAAQAVVNESERDGRTFVVEAAEMEGLLAAVHAISADAIERIKRVVGKGEGEQS